MASAGWGDAPKGAVEWGKEPLETKAKETQDVKEISEKIQNIKTNDESVHDNENEVEVVLADGSELYQSVHSFEDLGLNADLLKGVYALGYQKPSKIQASALPLLLSEPPKNMIGQSQAGTGKTATFSLNILSRVDTLVTKPQTIVLAPARELARQILDNIRDLGKYTSVTTVLAVPGSVGRGEKIECHVVVGTPGTIMDLIKKRQLDVSGIRVFVLDEADSMLDQQGLGDTSIRIKKY